MVSQSHSGWAREENSPIGPLSTILSLTSILSPPFFRVLAAIEGQKREYGSMVGINHTPMKSSEQSTPVHPSSDASSI